MENRMKIRHFLIFPLPGKSRAGPFVGRGVVRYGKDEKWSQTEAVKCMLAGDLEGNGTPGFLMLAIFL